MVASKRKGRPATQDAAFLNAFIAGNEITLGVWADALEESGRVEIAGEVRTAFARGARYLERVRFFADQSGWSYDPKRESPKAGRVRSAIRLADAEEWAESEGVAFNWDEDTQPDRSGIDHAGPIWECLAYPGDAYDVGPHESLSGVDLGESGYPTGPGRDPYARVVEAELAEQLREELRDE